MGGMRSAEASIGDPAHFLALIGDGVRDDGDHLTFALPQGADSGCLGPDMSLEIVDHAGPRRGPLLRRRFGGYAMGFVLLLMPRTAATSRELPIRTPGDGDDDCMRRFRLYGVLQPYNGGDLEYAGCGRLGLHRRLRGIRSPLHGHPSWPANP